MQLLDKVIRNDGKHYKVFSILYYIKILNKRYI